MELFTLTFLMAGTVVFMLGVSNKTKKARRGEKTTTGKVEEFGLVDNNKIYSTKYKAVIKSGLKKYEIEARSMPWLKQGEEVQIQMTGNQKVLGNSRLNNRAKVEMFIGVVLIVFPFVMFFAK